MSEDLEFYRVIFLDPEDHRRCTDVPRRKGIAEVFNGLWVDAKWKYAYSCAAVHWIPASRYIGVTKIDKVEPDGIMSNCIAPTACASDKVCVYLCTNGAAYARALYIRAHGKEALVRIDPPTRHMQEEEYRTQMRAYKGTVRAFILARLNERNLLSREDLADALTHDIVENLPDKPKPPLK